MKIKNAKLVGRLLHFVRDEEGASILEAAFVLPLLIFLVLGVIQFSITMNLYMTATSAAFAGLQAFDSYRGIANSYSAATAYAKKTALLGAWKIADADLSFQFWVGASACASDSACDNLLSANGPPPSGGPGASTKIQVQMNCQGLNLLPSIPFLKTTLSLPSLCPVTVQMNGVVQ